jgi:hypothetical protein
MKSVSTIYVCVCLDVCLCSLFLPLSLYCNILYSIVRERETFSESIYTNQEELANLHDFVYTLPTYSSN